MNQKSIVETLRSVIKTEWHLNELRVAAFVLVGTMDIGVKVSVFVFVTGLEKNCRPVSTQL